MTALRSRSAPFPGQPITGLRKLKGKRVVSYGRYGCRA
ncbi:hypothetical protein QFZ66_001193 [Streptomyces sp. B4I13]|nr:hypothetical protein [Streptomyces sp. B4I13]